MTRPDCCDNGSCMDRLMVVGQGAKYCLCRALAFGTSSSETYTQKARVLHWREHPQWVPHLLSPSRSTTTVCWGSRGSRLG